MQFTAKASGMKAETGSCECAEPEQFPCPCEDEPEPVLDKITKVVGSKPPKKEDAVKQADKAVKKIQKKVGEVVKQVSVK